MIELRQPCHYCTRLTENDECPECVCHLKTYGHYPREVRWEKVPGQPRAMTRFCGECNRELM